MATGTFEKQKEPHWGSRQSISFPFTASADGMVYIRVGSQTSSTHTSIYIKSNDGEYPFCAYAEKGALIAGCFVVRKGITYSVDDGNNNQTPILYFYPLVSE